MQLNFSNDLGYVDFERTSRLVLSGDFRRPHEKSVFLGQIGRSSLLIQAICAAFAM